MPVRIVLEYESAEVAALVLERAARHVVLTVGDLQTIPQIANTVVAGVGGLGRKLAWAHACEMPEPWDWVGPDELLMTIGHCVPALPQDQVRFIRALDDAGLAGVAIGDGAPAPTISPEMRAEADRLSFPLLLIGPDTPFSVIARAVATTNEHAEMQRLWRMSRLNLAVGATGSPRSLLNRITTELGQEVHVVDARHGTEIWPGTTRLSAAVRGEIAELMRPHLSRIPTRTHLTVGDWSGSCFPLPCNRPALLVVPETPVARLDPFAILHVASLMAVEVERLSAQRERLTRDGNQLFGRMIEGRLDSESAVQQLRRFGIKRMPLVVAALQADSPDLSDLLHDRRVGHLMAHSTDHLLLLMETRRLARVLSAPGLTVPLGTSAPIHALGTIADAAREARWALHAATSQGQSHVDYAVARPLFLPRTVSEAQNAVDTVLGAVLAYDREHGASLVRSLRAYLDCDRSWARAAERLGIHRQTLGARLAKIEQLTSRRLSCSADIADCWMALQALLIVDPEARVVGVHRDHL